MITRSKNLRKSRTSQILSNKTKNNSFSNVNAQLPLVIVNPKSAGGATQSRWAERAADFRAHFGAFQVAFTKRAGDGKALALRGEAVVVTRPALAFAQSGQVGHQQAVAAAKALRQRVPVLLHAGEAVDHHHHWRAPRRVVAVRIHPAMPGDVDAAARQPGLQPLADEFGAYQPVGIERHRGHVITGVVSAGAVAALAIVLRGGSGDGGFATHGHGPSDITPVSYRPTEIESLDTPGGDSTVFNLQDEDGPATVIWVTPDDTVEGI